MKIEIKVTPKNLHATIDSIPLLSWHATVAKIIAVGDNRKWVYYELSSKAAEYLYKIKFNLLSPAEIEKCFGDVLIAEKTQDGVMFFLPDAGEKIKEWFTKGIQKASEKMKERDFSVELELEVIQTKPVAITPSIAQYQYYQRKIKVGG